MYLQNPNRIPSLNLGKATRKIYAGEKTRTMAIEGAGSLDVDLQLIANISYY
jgi:hypothetical protein